MFCVKICIFGQSNRRSLVLMSTLDLDDINEREMLV